MINNKTPVAIYNVTHVKRNEHHKNNHANQVCNIY